MWFKDKKFCVKYDIPVQKLLNEKVNKFKIVLGMLVFN